MTSNEFDQFPIITGQWQGPLSYKGNPPIPRGGQTATVIDKFIFIFGGSAYNIQQKQTASSNNAKQDTPLTLVQDDLHCFDMSTSSWNRVTAKGSAPSPRYAHTAVAIGKKLLVMLRGVSSQNSFVLYFNRYLEVIMERLIWMISIYMTQVIQVII